MDTSNFAVRREDIKKLESYGLVFKETWQVVDYFEKQIADFFGAPFAVAVDCCTHALELCIKADEEPGPLSVPAYTYMSVPMMLDKIGINYYLNDDKWKKYYHLTPEIIDAAATWVPNIYQPGTRMCISFQFKKPLPIGRGGIILLDDVEKYNRLQRMVRDGRERTQTMWVDDVQELGYHYYMAPEDAARGIYLFMNMKDQPACFATWEDYRDIREMTYFRDR